MEDPRAELTPRSAAGLIDASFQLLCVRPALLCSLGSLHTVPLLVAFAALATLPGRLFPLTHPSLPLVALALLAVLGTALRPVALAATAVAVSALVRGEPARARDCLAAAARRGRALLAIAARALLLDLVTLGFLRSMGHHHLEGPLVAVEERSAAEARREAARLRDAFPGAHTLLGLHQSVIYLATLLNLWIGAMVAVELGRILVGFDAAAVRAFVAPGNLDFLLVLVFVAWFGLEPLRAVSKAMLLLDLRLREEGTDLKIRLLGLKEPCA